MDHAPPAQSLAAVRLITALGTIASAGVVVGITGAGNSQMVRLPAGPFGLWEHASSGRHGFAVLSVVSVFVLILAFVALYGQASRRTVGVRGVAIAAILWCIPVLLAQPLLSLDAYSYVAQGQMVVVGLDPYAGGPNLLGAGPLLDAVAPVWRATPAPYGPLALSLLHGLAAVTGAEHVPFVLLLRLLVVGSVIASALMAVRLAPPERAAVAVTLVAANPVVVLHLVGGAHIDALLGALAACVVLAARRQRWWVASLAAATAFALKVPGLVLVGYVLLLRLRAGGGATDTPARSPRRYARRLAGLVGVSVVVLVATVGYAALVPNGWGWLGVMDTPGKVKHVYTVAYLLGGLFYGVLHLVRIGVEFPDALSWARAVCGLVGALIILDLLLRASEKRQDWRRSAALLGAALTVVALAAPVIHAWYIAWGLVLVAACAGDRARRWMMALSVAVCFTAMPPLLVKSGWGLTLILTLLVVALAVVAAGGGRPQWGPVGRLTAWRDRLPRRAVPAQASAAPSGDGAGHTG
jgi:hypothetical protein